MKLLKCRRPREVRIFFKNRVKIDVNVSSAGKREKKRIISLLSKLENYVRAHNIK